MSELPRSVTDFLAEFLQAGGDTSRLAIYWHGMTTATWPGHE